MAMRIMGEFCHQNLAGARRSFLFVGSGEGVVMRRLSGRPFHLGVSGEFRWSSRRFY
jgi:hypothetical protein